MMKRESSSAGALTISPSAAEQETSADRANSYKKILHSSALIGGSTMITLAIGLLRTKAMAVILGPSGFGIMGMYLQIVEIARTVAQLGVQSSGVRQIADVVSNEGHEKFSRTVYVLRRLSLVCAVLGALLLAFSADAVSQWSFGNLEHSQSIRWLAVAVMCALLAGGQGALLQGMRRIGDMAKLAIYGGFLGTVVSIPLVYLKGQAGIAPSMVIAAACTTVLSWWYSRKVRVQKPEISAGEFLQESSSLLKLGIAFMVSSLLTLGTSYIVRILVMRHGGLDAVGIYQAAWTLGGLYVGFILQALGTDFYPRLVGIVGDDKECNKIVNEQAHVSLLLAMPGITATLTFAPLVISMLYSSSFMAAVEVLRWICLGMALRVMTYPLGYIIVAKNRQVMFFLSDLAWTVFNLALTLWAITYFGVNGVGMAYAASYIFHAVLVYPMARYLTGFRWSSAYFCEAWRSYVLIAAIFAAFKFLPAVPAYVFGGAATLICSYVSAGKLLKLVSPQEQSGPVRFLLKLCKWLR